MPSSVNAVNIIVHVFELTLSSLKCYAYILPKIFKKNLVWKTCVVLAEGVFIDERERERLR